MATLSSGLPDIVGDAEELAHFLNSSRKVSKKGIVHPSVYMPRDVDRSTSVFRHGAEPIDGLLRIWEANPQPGRNLHGIAICKAADVRAAELDVVPDEPPPRHANIVGWPWDDADPDEAKAKQKKLAGTIAQQANVIFP